MIRCDKCTWDQQFSHCGLWCTTDWRSTCSACATRRGCRHFVFVYASICFAVSVAVTGFPCTLSMELSDEPRTCVGSDRRWSSKVTTRFSETAWIGWASNNKHHLGIEVIRWECRQGFEMCDFYCVAVWGAGLFFHVFGVWVVLMGVFLVWVVLFVCLFFSPLSFRA